MCSQGTSFLLEIKNSRLAKLSVWGGWPGSTNILFQRFATASESSEKPCQPALSVHPHCFSEDSEADGTPNHALGINSGHPGHKHLEIDFGCRSSRSSRDKSIVCEAFRSACLQATFVAFQTLLNNDATKVNSALPCNERLRRTDLLVTNASHHITAVYSSFPFSRVGTLFLSHWLNTQRSC